MKKQAKLSLKKHIVSKLNNITMKDVAGGTGLVTYCDTMCNSIGCKPPTYSRDGLSCDEGVTCQVATACAV